MTKARRGIVEIETLRRYGRIPPGTRVRGAVVLTRRTDPSCLGYGLKVRLEVKDDPRPVAFDLDFDWDRGEDEPATWWEFFRGKHTRIQADNLLDAAGKHLTHEIESRNTGTDHQRFRVIRVEWKD